MCSEQCQMLCVFEGFMLRWGIPFSSRDSSLKVNFQCPTDLGGYTKVSLVSGFNYSLFRLQYLTLM